MVPRDWIEYAARLAEFAGVGVILAGLAAATLRYLIGLVSDGEKAYRQYRRGIGRAILLGLEILVAADIVATVTLSPTLTSVAVLAIVVLVRTFLSLSIQVEVEGRFPWQTRQSASRSAGDIPDAGAP